MNGNPSNCAKYTPDTAVDPEDASGGALGDRAVAPRVVEQGPSQPVLQAARDVRGLVLETRLHVRARRPGRALDRVRPALNTPTLHASQIVSPTEHQESSGSRFGRFGTASLR